MKKIIAMLLVLTMVLSFAACAKTDEPAQTTAAPETTAPAVTVESSLAVLESIWNLYGEDEKFFVRSVRDGRSGKFARTVWRAVEPPAGEPASTLVEVLLKSGRKHQIRVHFAEAGHPVLGDAKYGPKPPKPPAPPPGPFMPAWPKRS